MQKPDTAQRDEPAAPASPRLRGFLLAGAVALWVCRPLWASEGAALYGDGLPVVMLWIALVVFWLLGALGRREISLRFGLFDAAVLLLVALYAFSAMLGTARANPRPAINLLWEWTGLGLGYFCARQWIADGRQARAVLIAMLALALTLSVDGLYQWIYEFPQSRALYASDPDATLRAAGAWFAPGSPQRALFESRLQCNEPLATFALTNSLAGLLAAWLTVAVGIGIWSRDRRRVWLPAVAIGLPIAACLVLTKSRTGLLAIAVGIVALAAISQGRRPRAAALGFLALLAIASGVFFAFNQDLRDKAVKSLGYRFQYWQATWHMIQDYPLVGCGPGNFQDCYTRYKLPGASEEVADPHNFLLEVWATAGTPAAAAMLAVLVGLGATACAAAREVPLVPTPSVGTRRDSDGTLKRELQPVGAQPSGCSSRPFAVAVGAAGGYLLAWVVAMASPAPPALGLLLTGMAITMAVFWGFAGWIREGRLPSLVPAVAACVLLVHLLAAGGISYPGLAGSLWLLAALAVNLTGQERPKRLAGPAVWLLLAIALALATACQMTGYAPVLHAQAALLHAERLPPGSPDAAATLQRAAEADPWAATPLERLADLEFQAWLDSADATQFDQFESHRGQAVALNLQSSAAWQMSGDYYRRAYRKTGQTAYARKAADAYARAVGLYPTSPQCRAKLALALKEAGDGDGFRREAAQALELDRRTPHSDKRIPDTLRSELGNP
jgi:O-antigen ligase